MMKRILFLLVSGWLIVSCTQLLYTAYPAVGNQMQSVTRHMTATEDPATGLYGYLSDYGLWVIAPTYQDAQNFHDGMARVKTGGRYGIINPLGQWIVQPVFSWALSCDQAAASIRKGRIAGIELWLMEDPATELYGYLNHFGAWHITPQYEDGGEFDSDGFAVAKPVGGHWGVINRQNEWVIQPNFNNRYEAQNALSRLKR
nr:WG repeat-containing protein [Rikenellaceae bacterium]